MLIELSTISNGSTQPFGRGHPEDQLGDRQEAGLRYPLYAPLLCRDEIHPLLWRLEPFGLTHQLIMSNLVEIAQ